MRWIASGIGIALAVALATGCAAEVSPTGEGYEEEVDGQGEALAISSGTGTYSTGSGTIRSFTCSGGTCWCEPGTTTPETSCDGFEQACRTLGKTFWCCRRAPYYRCVEGYNAFSDYCTCS